MNVASRRRRTICLILTTTLADGSDRRNRKRQRHPFRPLGRQVGAETRAALEQLGHRIGATPGAFGGYQAIRLDREQGVYYGASESRKDGQAAGY